MRHVVSGLGALSLVFDQGPFVAKASVVEVYGGPCVAGRLSETLLCAIPIQ